MCPGAEQLLGGLAADGLGPDRVAILAWHVDYFNDPWVDPFSKKDYSARNWAYHEAFKKRDKNHADLYFTPMIMVNGRYPTSGYYNEGPPAARQALDERLKRAFRDPAEAVVAVGDATIEGDRARRVVSFKPATSKSNGREVLLGVAVVEDDVATAVPSGENGGKTLVDKWIVRSFQHQKVSLKQAGGEVEVEVKLEPGAKPDRSRVVAFLQDDRTGAVLGTAQVDWVAKGAVPSKP